MKNSFENSSADEFNRRSLSFIGSASKFVNFADHSSALPPANYQNIFDFKSNSSGFKHETMETVLNNDFPSSSKVYEEINSKGTSPKIDKEMDSNCKPATSSKEIDSDEPSPPLLCASVNGSVQLGIQGSIETPVRSPLLLSPTPFETVISIESKENSPDKLDRLTTPTLLDVVTPNSSNIQQNSCTLDRSAMPLPPTPLHALTPNNPTEKNFRQSSEKLDRSTMPLPPIPVYITSNESTEKSSHALDRSTTPILVDNIPSNESKKNNLNRSTMPLPPIPLDVVTSTKSNKKSSDKLDRSTMPLSPIPLDAEKSFDKHSRSTTPTLLNRTTSNESKEKSFEHSSYKFDRSTMPLPPTPLDAEKSFDKLSRSTTPTPLNRTVSNESKTKSFEQSSYKLDRSTMPLPPTPLDAEKGFDRHSRSTTPTPLNRTTSNESKEKSFEHSFYKFDRSTMPLPPIPLDAKKSFDKLSRSTTPTPLNCTISNEPSFEQSSYKLDRSTMPLPPTPLDAKKSFDKLSRSTTPTPLNCTISNESKEKSFEQSSYKLDRSTMPLPPTPLDAEKGFDRHSRSTTPTPLNRTTSNESKEKSFEQSSYKLDRSTMPLPPIPLDAVASNDSKEQSSPDKLDVPLNVTINERLLPVANGETVVCLDKDYVISDYEFYSMQKQQNKSDGSNVPMYLELQSLDADLGNYVIMHKIKDRKLKKPSYAYDYVYYPYIEMFRRKLRQSGVPPRRVKREGYTALASVNTNTEEKHVIYVNIKRSQDTTLFLPPRGNDALGIPTVSPEEQHSHLEAVVPPRNLPRNGCYLSAPSAIPL